MNHLSDQDLCSLLRESYPVPAGDTAFRGRVLRALPPRKSLLVRALEFVASPWFLWLVTVALCIVFRDWILECARICLRAISTSTLPTGDTLMMLTTGLAVFIIMLAATMREAEEY